MEGFTIASVTAECTTLSHRALSTTTELDSILAHGTFTDPVSQKLKSLSAKVRQFDQAVERLRASLNNNTAVSKELQHVLAESLPNCNSAVGVLSKQIKRIGPETRPEAINLGALQSYEALAESYIQLFAFEGEILSIPSHEEQAERVKSTKGQQILMNAERCAQLVKQMPDVLIDTDASQHATASSKGPMLSSASAQDDLPPSFEEAIATPPRPQAGGSNSESSSGKGGFLSSFSSSFKAMTAAMRPKPEPFVSALCQAATRGDVAQIKGFLGEGANINGRNEDGYTALICATRGGRVEAAQFLLDSSADHNVKDSGKKSKPPFFHAIEVESEPLIELYLARGVDVNEKSITGQPYLIDVVTSGNVSAIKLLLTRGANSNTTDITGNRIIALAVKKGDLPVVKLLLEYGADRNSRDCMTGNPILAVAFNLGRQDLVDLLLSQGADPNTKTVTGTNLVVEALKKNNLELVKDLLARGADANARDLMGKRMLALTIDNKTITDTEKETLSKLLLSRGADPNESMGWGRPTLFSSVVASDKPRLIKMFLEHGANANASPAFDNGDTYLLRAMDRNNWDLVKLLLQYAANPNEADKQGRVPLLVGQLKGRPETAKLLIQHGADVNKMGSISPFALARAVGDSLTEQLLRAHGVVVPVDEAEPPRPRGRTDDRGKSPLPGYSGPRQS